MAGFQAVGAVFAWGGGGVPLGDRSGTNFGNVWLYFSRIFLGSSPGASLMGFASILAPFWDVFLMVFG